MVFLSIVGLIIFLVFVAWFVDYPYSTFDNHFGGTPDIEIKTEVKVKDEPKKVKVTNKLRRPKYTQKDKMARFEEEAFWMNVFDDDEGC